MMAPPKSSDPTITPEVLAGYDGFLVRISVRSGNFATQWKAFWDATGKLWAEGALYSKYVCVFVSTGGLGGGQEVTVVHFLSTFVHHGMVIVPLGYKNIFEDITNIGKVHSGLS